MDSWELLHFIREVRNFIRDVHAVLVHIPHSLNEAANRWAKWRVGTGEVFVADQMPD